MDNETLYPPSSISTDEEATLDFPYTSDPLLPPCCDYCTQHLFQYQYIMGTHPKWLTISPPANEDNPDKYYDMWLDDIEDLLKCSDAILGVVEFASYRMHFHIMYSCKDNVKSYRLVNRFRKHAMVKIYDGGPKAGLHYLFKDIKNTMSLVNINPIITETFLRQRKQDRVDKIKEMKRKEKVQQCERTIPECFLAK